MDIYKYEPKHFKIVQFLHETQKSPLSKHLESKNIPEIGYIVANSNYIVAAGFLRKLEGGYAMIDTLVSNGALPGDTRHLGLSLLIDELIKSAVTLNLTGIISLTTDNGVISRAKSLGFRADNQTVVSLMF